MTTMIISGVAFGAVCHFLENSKMCLINVPCMWWDFTCVLFSSSMLVVSVSVI